MYAVYVLRSMADHGFYVGITNNLKRRLLEHNRGYQRSTRARRPLELVYSEQYDTRGEAREREGYWKSGQGRERLRRLLGQS